MPLAVTQDSFDTTFDTIKLPVTSITMVLYSGYYINKNKKSFTKLFDIVHDFSDGFDGNEEYEQYVQSGTSARENVRGILE